MALMTKFTRVGYPAVNRYFTMAIFLLPAVGGSAVSFLYNGGALWAFFDVARGRRELARQPRFQAVVAAIYIYCAALFLSVLVNPQPLEGLRSLVGLASLLLFPFAYSTWRIANKDEIVAACLIACATACIVSLPIALTEAYFLGGKRVEGAAGNTLIFGNVVALTASVALIGVFHHRGWRRCFMLAGFFAGVLAVAYSVSRGPFILLVVNAAIVAAIHARGRHRGLWLLLIAVLLGAPLVLTLAEGDGLSAKFHLMFSQLENALGGGDFNSSVGLRLAMWQTGIDLWLQKPLLGHGAGNIRELIAFNLLLNYGAGSGFTHFHNVFVNTLVEGGLIGLLGLVSMISFPVLAALRVLRHQPDGAARFGATLLLVYFSLFLITGSTNIVLHHDIMDAVFMCFLAVGLFLTLEDTVPEAGQQTEP